MTDTTSIEQRLRHLFVLVAEKEPVAPPPIEPDLWPEHGHRRPRHRGHRGHRGHRALASALVAAVVIAAAVVAITYGPRSSPAPGSGALGSNGEASVAGSYSMTYLAPRTFSSKGGVAHFFEDPAPPIRLDMNANGIFTVPGYVVVGSRHSGTWRESAGTVTLTFTFPGQSAARSSLIQTARQLGSNLGSASKPGIVVSNGKQIERWYAVRDHGRSGYEAAKAQWEGAALVVGTGAQDGPLQVAVADLQRGEISDTGRTSRYAAAISGIKSFEALPITGVTPKMASRENAAIATINEFFGLPRAPWSGDCDASGPGKQAAARAWQTEPVQSLTGVAAAPLKKAVKDLRQGLTTDRGDTSCYAAAIVDLQSLESATPAEMAKNVPDGDEIGYLNQFFNGRQYVLGGPDNPVVPQ